jgi:hypothetical protein
MSNEQLNAVRVGDILNIVGISRKFSNRVKVTLVTRTMLYTVTLQSEPQPYYAFFKSTGEAKCGGRWAQKIA